MNNKINYFKFAIIILVAFFLQTALLKRLFDPFSSNLVLAALIAGAFVSCNSDFLVAVFLSATIFDFLSSSVFGVFLACFLAAAVLAHLLKEKFAREGGFFNLALLSAFSAVFFNLCYIFIFYFVLGNTVPSYIFLFGQTFLDAFFSAALEYPLVKIISQPQCLPIL